MHSLMVQCLNSSSFDEPCNDAVGGQKPARNPMYNGHITLRDYTQTLVYKLPSISKGFIFKKYWQISPSYLLISTKFLTLPVIWPSRIDNTQVSHNHLMEVTHIDAINFWQFQVPVNFLIALNIVHRLIPCWRNFVLRCLWVVFNGCRPLAVFSCLHVNLGDILPTPQRKSVNRSANIWVIDSVSGSLGAL